MRVWLRLAVLCPVLFAAFPACAAEQAGAEEAWRPALYRELFTAAEGQRSHVRSRTHDLYDFPFVDGQWEGIICDSDGDVWFAVSSHSDDLPGQLFVYKRAADKVHHVADLGQVCGEKLSGNPPQDKIHSQMFQDGDYLYCGTCEGHAIHGNPYQGGYWLRIHRRTGLVENMGKSVTGDGLLCVSYDPFRKVLYGHTNRSGELSAFDIASRTERVLGVPWQDVIDAWKDSDDPEKPKEIWPRGLTHMVTSDGRVFGMKPPPGTVWCYDPETDRITTRTLEMPLPRELQQLAAAGDKPDARTQRQWDGSSFHLHVWDEQDGCFYIIRSFDQMLCRFYPPEEENPARLEMVHEMGLEERRYGLRPAACVLTMVGRTVYYTPHTGWGGVTHLTSYNLDERRFVDHGPIVVEGGRRVCEIHALDAGNDGKLYAVAFVYSIEGVDPVRPYAMRDKWPFHARFAIIDPTSDLAGGD